MAKHRTHSIEFKRQVVQEFLGGESPHATAEFHVCTACGVVPVVTSRIDGRLYAVVSVNAFENVEPALLRRAPATFEGENEQARLSRRKRNWIADVQFETTS